MQRLYENNLDDKEAAIFYSLALNAAADPTDKTYSKQKKAGVILYSMYPSQPDHPGVVHYLIHTYDSPELAHLGLPAARKYASVAPSSAHALHMPSHIFTRLGYWDESIQSNLASVESAKCYAESSGIKGHWDEELHGMDYLVYAYLQKGDNEAAKKQWDYMKTMKQVFPYNFKVSYSFAAIPARYVLENKLWKEAAALEPHDPNLDWKNQQWQKAIIHFTRLLGSVHTNNAAAAGIELNELKKLQKELLDAKDAYKANQVQIQVTAGEAWMKYRQGSNDEALRLMKLAAAMEDSTEKHPVTPGEVLPARELLADMLLDMNMHSEALAAYEEDLRKHPNRFNGLYGAAVAAERAGKKGPAVKYYKQLLEVSASAKAQRAEIDHAKQFLATQSI
jgi:tetratricopeptide (TPR) repeat protein